MVMHGHLVIHTHAIITIIHRIYITKYTLNIMMVKWNEYNAGGLPKMAIVTQQQTRYIVGNVNLHIVK